MTATMGKEMVEGKAVANPQEVAPKISSKKSSWFRTILWMLEMVLIFNLVAAAVAYFLWFRH